MSSINHGLVFSIAFHVVVAGSAYVILPNIRAEISDTEEIVVVELINIAEETNAPRAVVEPEEKPEPEKVVEQEPEPEPEPAPPPPAPEPVVKASEPEPAPPPPPAEPEPEIAALPPEPEPEPEPEPAPEKKVEPEPEPAPAPKPVVPTPSQVLADAKPKKKPKPPDPFASVLKTLEDLKKQVPAAEEAAAKEEKDKEEEIKKPSFEEQIAHALSVKSTKSPDASKPISISVREAVAAQLRRCWIVPAGAKNAEELVISIRVDMNPDATVRNSLIADMERAMTDPFYRAAAESALRATKNPRCQPLPLPLDQYEQWQTMTLNFNPQDML